MAKKRKTSKNSSSVAKDSLEISGTFDTLRALAAQNVMKTRSFGPFDYVVKDNRELLDCTYYLEVDLQGKPVKESWLLLQEKAQRILTANFCKREKADADRGWVKATWSRGAKAQEAGLDPTISFEVGVAKSRRPDPQRAMLAADLVELGEQHSGLGLVPNKEGDQLVIPGMGVLYTSDLVVVTRGGNDLGLCSIAEGLFQHPKNVKVWAVLLPEEEKEARRAQEATGAFDVFVKVADEERLRVELEARREEEERLRVEQEARRAAWTVLALDEELNGAWDVLTQEANTAWDEARDEVNMVLGIVRPGKPSTEAVRTLYNAFSSRAFNAIAEWVKESYVDRKTLAQSVVLAAEAFPASEQVSSFVPSKWFTQEGEVRAKLKSLADYNSQEEWKASATDQLSQEQVTTFRNYMESKYSKIQQQTTP